MNQTYILEQEFEGIKFNAENLNKGEYELCVFKNCQFLNIDLSHYVFTDCQFYNCDLSNTSIHNTSFKSVVFSQCKQIGMSFDQVNDFLFSVEFNECNLDYTSFYKKKLKNTKFIKCSLKEAEFSAADLMGASFYKSELSGAVFESSNIEKADFRESYNYQIDPETNRIKNAKFSLAQLPGLLNKYKLKIE